MTVSIGSFRLSPEFFQKTRFVNRCLAECARECCTEGVWLSIHDAHRIVEHGDQFQTYLIQPIDLQQWNLSRPANISTPLMEEGTPNERCWFLMQNGLCALHSFALDKNMPVQRIKPFFCLMFPLTLVDIDINVTEISIDNKAYKTCLIEGTAETWLYEQFAPELRRILGVEGYAELERQFPH